MSYFFIFIYSVLEGQAYRQLSIKDKRSDGVIGHDPKLPVKAKKGDFYPTQNRSVVAVCLYFPLISFLIHFLKMCFDATRMCFFLEWNMYWYLSSGVYVVLILLMLWIISAWKVCGKYVILITLCHREFCPQYFSIFILVLPLTALTFVYLSVPFRRSSYYVIPCNPQPV